MNSIFRHILLAAAILSAAAASASTISCGGAFLSPALAAASGDVKVRALKAMPVEVSGIDLLSKAYGIAECELDSAGCFEKVVRTTGLLPLPDEYGYWLDSADGYRLSYGGMIPDVSALARIADGQVGDFAFFFIFPYSEGERDWANRRQAEFCGSLLQELSDCGLPMEASNTGEYLPMTDDDIAEVEQGVEYYNVATRHQTHPVDILLREDPGQFILAIHVAK